MDELQKIKKKETITVENLWQVIESHQGETSYSYKLVPYLRVNGKIKTGPSSVIKTAKGR